MSHTQHSHVASGPHVRHTALEGPHVGRERLPGPCLLLCTKYLALCLGFNKHSMNSCFFFFIDSLSTTFVARERIGQLRMIALNNGYNTVVFKLQWHSSVAA